MPGLALVPALVHAPLQPRCGPRPLLWPLPPLKASAAPRVRPPRAWAKAVPAGPLPFTEERSGLPPVRSSLPAIPLPPLRRRSPVAPQAYGQKSPPPGLVITPCVSVEAMSVEAVKPPWTCAPTRAEPSMSTSKLLMLPWMSQFTSQNSVAFV